MESGPVGEIYPIGGFRLLDPGHYAFDVEFSEEPYPLLEPRLSRWS